MHALNPILGKSSHLAVLRVLYHTEAPLSGREVQRRANLSNRATMLALQGLVRLRVLLCEETLSSHHYQLNPRHYLWSKGVRAALDAEGAFWDDLRKTVRRWVIPRPEAAMVTGSIAREENAEGGVLELHFLFSGGRERLQAYRSLERLIEQIDARYALRVTATFMDMRNMDDPEFQILWRRIAREGVLLFGKLP
jgi:hypothetical protein